MKLKKLIPMLLVTLSLLCFLSTTVSAAPTWYIANAEKTGIGSGMYLVMLTDTAATPAFTKKWCQLTPAQAKSMLAVCMTAMSLGKTVMVYMDATLTTPVITSFYINQ